MKTILVPTDFSECSVNAFNYAAGLAKASEAKILLLHVYQLPFHTDDVSAIEIPFEQMEIDFNNEMNRLVNEQKKKFNWDLNVTVISRVGITPFEIDNVAQEMNVDLIVMGMHGKITVVDRIFGDNTTEMIKKANRPLLLVPPDSHFATLENIAVAFDFKHPEDLKRLSIAKDFTNLFKSKLLAFSIVSEKENVSSEKEIVNSVLKDFLHTFDHQIYYYVADNIQKGILNFIEQEKAKMLVMFHHSHNIFARMFSTIVSMQISFNVKIPLLIITEKIPD